MRKIYSILTIVTVVIIVTANINAQISGTVFRDLPVTGLTQNIYGVKEANEPGVEGVTVTVYPGGMNTTTAADGSWSIPGVSGSVRVEFSGWPSYMKESADGGGANSSVQFVTAPANNVDFGLYIPASYSDLNIDIMTSVAVSGDPNGGGTSAGEGSVIFHSYTATGDYTSPVGPSIISFGEVGSTFGGAWQSKSKTYFLAAYAKRYVGFKSDPGSVFRINDPAGTPTVSEYFSLDALGFSTGVIPPRTDLPADKGPSHDIDMFGLTGTVSLGDIELDLEQENLYIVNLYDKKLYKVNIGNPAKATITAADVTSYVIPDPGCANGNWRPFALGLDEARNVLMIGGVCDAAFGDRSDLHAYLYEFDLNTQTMGVSSVLDFALDFQRGDTWGSHPVPPITNHWNIWSDEPSDWLNAAIPSISVLRTHPEPLLADIEFETDGSMILGFRDIWGDRFGAYNYAPEQSNTNAYSCHANGDLYKVKKIAGVYELENNGGFSDGSSGCGVGNGDGPGGGEFYCDDDYSSHANVPQGGLAYLMGEEHFVAESMDPHTVDSGGSRWMSNTPGNSTQGYQYYKTNDGSSGTFAKASGTGDVELLLDPAPIEIGNLVWEDTDGDGVQDPGELGISGVTVELKQGGTTIATAITDANGNYIFSNDPNGTTTASHIYNITQLVPGMDYTLTVPTTSGSNSLTTKDSGEGANPDLNDSDADTGTGEISVLALSIPVTGANNHSFDIGYASQSSGLGIECWAISDENEAEAPGGLSGSGQTDYLFKLDKVTGVWSLIGSTTVMDEESMAYDPFNGELYSVNGDQMGILDQTTGAYTVVSSHYGDVRLPDGSTHDIDDVDGLCFDPFGNVIWATERVKGTNVNDLLFKIDASTHEIITNAFGTNIDAVPVQEAFDPVLNKNVYDVDDIAVDPETGDLYAIQNEGGAGGVLTIIDKTNGNVIINKGTFDEPGSPSSPVDDIEGLTFFNSGQLLASTGDNGPDSQDKNRLFLINKNSAEASSQSPIDPSGERYDFEALTCLTDEPNKITGSLFLDDNCNSVYDGNDVILDGYQINLYRDVTNNDDYDAGTDVFIKSTTTDASGTFVFEFEVASYSDFVITVDDPSSIPGYDHFSTTDVHEASFISGGNTDSDNDFGVCEANNSCNLTSAGKTNETCNDNGTASDATDDYITFNLDPTGLNLGTSYTVSVNNGGTITPTSGVYGSATSFQLQNGSANGTTYTITITDNADANCTITTTVQQNSCSDLCALMDAGKTNETCNDNGTPSDATDDYITFSLDPTGLNLGTSYTVSVDNGGNVSPTSGVYGSATSFQLQNGSANGTTYTITITDNADPNCTITTTVQQNSCSDVCALTDAGKNNEACNNAGTSGDESDDYISFDLNPAGLNISAGYTVTVDNGGTITPTSGTYGSATSFQLQNGSADGTTYTITITDNADANCTITTTVNQNSCSTCTTSATFTTDCDDNGTLPNENDDYFNLVVTGTVTDGTGNYVVKIGTYTSAATASGASVTITGDGQGGNPMLAADGSSTYTVRIEDANDSTCFTEYTVGPVDECSECPTPDCLNVQVKKNN